MHHPGIHRAQRLHPTPVLVISATARSPLRASIRPPDRRSGISIASACPTTPPLWTDASISPTCCRTAGSSARPRTTVNPRRVIGDLSEEIGRRRSGSISVTRKSGRANANGIPGRPAPLPMSAIRSPRFDQLGECPLLSRCRFHNRSASWSDQPASRRAGQNLA